MDDSSVIPDPSNAGNGEASTIKAQESVGDPQVTRVDAATAGRSAPPSRTMEATSSVLSAKRTADAAADVEAADDEQQPDEPAAKRARSGDPVEPDRSVGLLQVTIPAANGQQQQPLACESGTAAPAASPSKGRVSPLPSARSPSLRRQGDVVLRLLVHDRSVATIIGKGGSTVKAIQSSTGARIQVMPPVPGVEERVVVVSIPEDHQQEVIGAERALHAIQRKLIVDVEPTAAAVLDRIQQELAPESTAAATSGTEGTEPTAEPIQATTVSPTPTAAATAATTAPIADSEEQQLQLQDQHEQPPNQLSEHAAEAEADGGATAGALAGESAEASDAVAANNEQSAEGGPAAQTSSAAAAAEQSSAERQTELQEADAQPIDPATLSQQEEANPLTESGPPQQPGAAKAIPLLQEDKPAAAAIPALGGDTPAAPRTRSVQHMARLLVSPSQASSLLTAGAAGLRSVKEQSSAFVKVLQPDESPYCALEGDRVTQVVGTAQQVFKAAILLGAHLRKHPATEWPGGLHAGLANRGGRRYGGRSHHRSPPPPPPPRPAYAGQYGHPGYGLPPHGYGAYGAVPAYGAPPGPPGYRPPAPPGAYGAPQAGVYDPYQSYGY